MNASKIEFRDGQFGYTGLTGWHALSAEEIFDAKKSDEHPELSGVEFLGFGSFEFNLEPPSFSGDSLRIQAYVCSDGVKIPTTTSVAFDVDYVAISSTVIPLRFDYANPIERELRPILNSLERLAPEVVAGSLIKRAPSLGFSLHLSDAFFAYISSLSDGDLPSPTDSELWGYQQKGFSWMFRLWQNGLGGILADEMGVGKTLQLIALSCRVADENAGPALIVVPSGLLMKWCKDFVDHAPSFMADVHVHHGPRRSKSSAFLASQRIILTTYSMAVQDQEILGSVDFASICCDEAHEVKESRTLKSQSIKALSARSKFLATGTPIQNNLADYWTLIDIVEPGLLGSWQAFQNRAEDTPSLAMTLVEQTKHRILRRTQEQVGIEIPEGHEFYVPLLLSDELFAEYRTIGKTNEIVPAGSGARGALQYKRQFCAHPSVFQYPRVPHLGEKSLYLLEELRKISEASEKVVVFVADFNEPRDLYLALINRELPEFWTGTIDGRTPNELRHVLLQSFQEFAGPAALFINPLVGGQGLDIVAANHVFHMNPAWNPARTDQATFRVTRPGQTRETWSHHLYYVNTVEESIHNLVLTKRELSESALEVAEAEAEANQNSIINYLRSDEGIGA